ncbi:MAG: class II aldolase/adducin family protein [bacterium]|nr:class II aldolase/adducin family protein [bacterium]
MSIEQTRQELQDVGRRMVELGLAWGNAGNISARTDDAHFLITASGTRLEALADDDLVECPLDSSVAVNYVRKPSKELPMHRAVYETRPDINVILHSSPFYSTLIACSDEAIPGNGFIESMYYLERVGRVPYAHAGSADLGAGVRAQAAGANVLLLENHGVLVYDTTVREALMALQTLEYTCRMLVTAKSAGIALRPLPPETVQDFLDNAGYKPRRAWKG